jgi:hypothetical protein
LQLMRMVIAGRTSPWNFVPEYLQLEVRLCIPLFVAFQGVELAHLSLVEAVDSSPLSCVFFGEGKGEGEGRERRERGESDLKKEKGEREEGCVRLRARNLYHVKKLDELSMLKLVKSLFSGKSTLGIWLRRTLLFWYSQTC